MSDYHARVSVRVYRERGALLARLAHDVELEIETSRVGVSGDRVDVQFDPGALKVRGALTDHGIDPSLLDESAETQIITNARKDVLEVRAYPSASFSGRFTAMEQDVRVEGELELHGRRHAVSFMLTREPGDETRFSGELTLTPSRWGIAPYRALLGALKLQDKVDLTIVVSGRALTPTETQDDT